MSTEAAFLKRIRAAPDDSALRLVYADWLEEHDDPRGALVRIETEMRQLPVFCDRYWKLKPRRNELRERAPADWLKVMRYGTECLPVIGHGYPEGCKERWRLIREFVEQWHQFHLGDAGGNDEAIQERETWLRRKLPSSVREWVAFFHDLEQNSLNSGRLLRDGYEMEELEGHSAISLLLQAEGDYHWAVRHKDLKTSDPPVHGFHLEYGDDEPPPRFVPDARNPVASSVSSFVLEYIMTYTRSEAGGFSTDVARPEKLLRELKAEFEVQCTFDRGWIFEGKHILVWVGSSIWTERQQLHVHLSKKMPRNAIPAFLWDYTKNGGSFHGQFIRTK